MHTRTPSSAKRVAGLISKRLATAARLQRASSKEEHPRFDAKAQSGRRDCTPALITEVSGSVSSGKLFASDAIAIAARPRSGMACPEAIGTRIRS